ncbi:MAG: hypothetical protein QXI16_00585 [Sulfolobaceae archaeon]
MSKSAVDIKKYGKIKPYFDKVYKFNSIDIETYNNELFILGFYKDNKYQYVENNFYKHFNELLIDSVRWKYDILTWSRYDNTHLFKLILENNKVDDINKILERVNHVTPIFKYKYRSFEMTIVNIIKDSMIIEIKDNFGNRARTVTIYNLKNLFKGDLLNVAKDYGFSYYSKLGDEYHIIDKERYLKDKDYKDKVIASNLLDNKVIIDIAYKFLENFKDITGVYPKSIFTSGSIARSFLLTYKDIEVKDMQFRSIFKNNKHYDELLDYSMKSYHGGKIESYVIGYIKNAKIIDISAAYPYSLSKLPKLTNTVIKSSDLSLLNRFYYAFIKCDIFIGNKNLIHPTVVKNPLNESNISPVGYLENVIITKIEYDYLLDKGAKITVYDYIGVVHEDIYPYKKLVNYLFESRLKSQKNNLSKSLLFKDIINSLYGITYELTDIYLENINNDIYWEGYRAGDFFNPILASYMTSLTRTYLSSVSQNIIDNKGEVYLNMTDSIIYNGEVTLDVFSDTKTLGKFDMPEDISDIMILGAGRYEYYRDLKKKYVVKSRGFSVKVKDKAFYKMMDFKDEVKIDHRTFVTIFKATTNKYSFKELGYLIDDEYKIDPFNIGAKRIIDNLKVDITKEFTTTHAVYLEKGMSKLCH